jgi:hypothetical protein
MFHLNFISLTIFGEFQKRSHETNHNETDIERLRDNDRNETDIEHSHDISHGESDIEQ